jgi:glycosyltransferase involved in cell wall biosynthesis
MRILGFERTHGAGCQYRVAQPLYKLRQHGLAEILTIHQENVTDFNFVTDKVMESDVIIIQRPQDDKWFNIFKTLQKLGRAMVIDTDDHPFMLSPLNPAYKYYGTTEVKYVWPDGKADMLWENGKVGFNVEDNISRMDYLRDSFRRADMVSVTTEELKKKINGLNSNVKVLPNLIDFDIYPKVEFVKKEVRIGWQGGVSHYEDLFMIVPAIKKIMQKHSNVKFVFFGDTKFYGLFKDIPQDRIEWHNWVQYAAYPYKLATLNLDIGLCPVIDNEFNRAKSEIKFLENSVFKVPSICSNIPPYTPVVDGQNSLLANDNEWFDKIDGLIQDKEKRIKMGQRAYDYCFENCNADTKAHLWLDAYDSILKKDILEVIK